MQEEYWLKWGFKENGDLVCVRILPGSKPTEEFFYTENGEHKEVKNPSVIKLSREVIGKINNKMS